MSRRRSLVLLAAAAWTFYVWLTRIVLIWRGDESAGFKAVHTALAVVSIAFGIALVKIGWSELRAARHRAAGGDPTSGG